MKAISEATGKSIASIKQEYSKLGDLGLVAQARNKIIP
jgi:ATP-dependent DNA ligase